MENINGLYQNQRRDVVCDGQVAHYTRKFAIDAASNNGLILREVQLYAARKSLNL